MNDIDRKIKEALRKEDADVWASFESEPPVFDVVMETFRGRYRWLAIMAVLWAIVFMVLGVYCAIQFFDAQETRDLLLWGAAAIICLLGVSMMKIWYWMELNKNAVTREMKRLELQIARLSGRLGG